MNYAAPWLRWFDLQGNMLPISEEIIDRERQRAERLAERLRELGEDPEKLS